MIKNFLHFFIYYLKNKYKIKFYLFIIINNNYNIYIFF